MQLKPEEKIEYMTRPYTLGPNTVPVIESMGLLALWWIVPHSV
jgi:hypothetical protein